MKTGVGLTLAISQWRHLAEGRAHLVMRSLDRAGNVLVVIPHGLLLGWCLCHLEVLLTGTHSNVWLDHVEDMR